MTQARSASSSTVPRTAAATAARRRQATARMAHEVCCRIDELDDARLAVVAATALAACLERGLAVPDLRHVPEKSKK